MNLTFQTPEGQPAYRIDAGALNNELAVALGGWCNGWSASHNASQAIVTLDDTRSDTATQDLVAATVAAHVLATAAREATISAQILGDADALVVAKANLTVKYLVSHTPAECSAWVQLNVSTLAKARDLLADFAVALSILARKKMK